MTIPTQNENESFINVAFRIAVCFLILLVITVSISWGRWRVDHAQGDRPSNLSNRVPLSWSSNDIPSIPFTDVTKDSGIRFLRNNGGTGNKFLPETMGGGVAFFDFDNDGDQDLLLLDGCSLDGKPGNPDSSSTLLLMENDGNGKFRELSPKLNGLISGLHGMGVAAADFNADGWMDVFVTNVGGNRLFANRQGTFVDVSAEAGVEGDPQAWSTSCTWLDYDRDGWLDLFVCNYVKWDPEIDRDVHYALPTIGKAYGPPMQFEGTCSYLYRNQGDGTFRDVSAEAGIEIRNPINHEPLGKALGVCTVDLNQDGWSDLVVANDTVQNFVFLNQKDGTFEEIGERTGIAFDSYGGTRGAMGIDAGRFQDHQTLGISIGNFANEMTALYVARKQSLLFADEAIHQGIGSSSLLPLTFGVFFFDVDLDGWLDLLTVNGHIEPDINKVASHQQYQQPLQIFWNMAPVGGSGFALTPASKVGMEITQPLVGRGSAYADIDGDGDLDVVVVQNKGPVKLFRNDQSLGRSWIRIDLRAPAPNTFAIGSVLEIKLHTRTLLRNVSPYRGYLSQSEIPVTIGLGDAKSIQSVRVTWPDGSDELINDIPVNQTISVFKK